METKVGDKGLSVSVSKDQIIGVYIDAYGSYNSARLVVKPNDNDYAHISYEWEGKENIPMFVYDLMSFIKQNSEKSSFTVKDKFYCLNEELYKEYLEREKDKGV